MGRRRRSWWRRPTPTRWDKIQSWVLALLVVAVITLAVLTDGHSSRTNWSIGALATPFIVFGVIRGDREGRRRRGLWDTARTAVAASDAELDVAERIARRHQPPASRRERTLALVVLRTRMSETQEGRNEIVTSALTLLTSTMLIIGAPSWRWMFTAFAVLSLYWLITAWREQTRLRQRAQELESIDPEASSPQPPDDLSRRQDSTGTEPDASLNR